MSLDFINTMNGREKINLFIYYEEINGVNCLLGNRGK